MTNPVWSSVSYLKERETQHIEVSLTNNKYSYKSHYKSYPLKTNVSLKGSKPLNISESEE